MCLVFCLSQDVWSSKKQQNVTMIYTSADNSSQHGERLNDTKSLLRVNYIYSVIPPPNLQG